MRQRTAVLVLTRLSVLLAVACSATQADDAALSGDAAPEALAEDDATGDDGGAPLDDSADGVTPDDASASGATDSAQGPPFDAGLDGICAQPLAPGDLAIVELMIASVAGAGDHGQWVEVRSTLPCAIDVQGLHAECPHGSKVAKLDVTGDLWLPAGGTFVITNSGDPAQNHWLPGPIVTFNGQPGDALRKKGDTVSLWMNGALIDAVTYPALKLTVGASVAFPRDCDAGARSDFAHWATSTSSWFPGFFGTPNAPNTDVHCF
jgi:hypothetical protein